MKKIVKIEKTLKQINNRIVVDYGKDEKLVLLGVINSKTNEELTYEEILDVYYPYFEIVKNYGTSNVVDFKSLQLANLVNKEGYVIRFNPSNFRVKVKFKDYCRLHSIVTKITARDIWQTLKNGESFDDIKEIVPDEFFNWVNKIITRLEIEFTNIEFKTTGIFHNILKNLEENYTKKDFALAVQAEVELKLRGIVFLLFNEKNKEYKEAIWKMIYPAHETPFLNNTEDE